MEVLLRRLGDASTGAMVNMIGVLICLDNMGVLLRILMSFFFDAGLSQECSFLHIDRGSG